jgi:hypothetical protein
MSDLKFTKGEYFIDYDINGEKFICKITKVKKQQIYYDIINKKSKYFYFVDWFHPKSTFALTIEKIDEDEAMVEML